MDLLRRVFVFSICAAAISCSTAKGPADAGSSRDASADSGERDTDKPVAGRGTGGKGGAGGRGGVGGRSDGGGPYASGPCDASGTWEIVYSTSSDKPCVQRNGVLRVFIAGDEDAGSDSIFPGRAEQLSDCGPNMVAHHDESLLNSAEGCTIAIESHNTWCSRNEQQCSHMKLELRILEDAGDPLRASVTGTTSRCWCPSSAGFDAPLTGTARRIGE